MVTAFRLHTGLQTRFRTFDTGFICASAIRYYISSPILDVDRKGEFYFRQLGLPAITGARTSGGV
jgi:hypothetical protein